MRCIICNDNLNDYELTRKDPQTGEYLDTCSNCTKSVREALQDFEESPYRHNVEVENESIL